MKLKPSHKSTLLILLLQILLQKSLSQTPERIDIFKSEKVANSPIYSITVLNDGVTFASTIDGSIFGFFPQTNAIRKISSYTPNFNYIPSVFINDKNLAVVYGLNFDVYEIENFKKIFYDISSIPFILNYNTALKYGGDKFISYYDNNSNSFKRTVLTSERQPVASAIGDKKIALVQFALNKIFIHDLKSGFFLKSIDIPENLNYKTIAGMLFSKDDKYITISTYNGKIYIYDTDAPKLVAKFNAKITSPWSITTNKNKTTLIFLTEDKKINFLQFKNLTLSILEVPQDKIQDDISCINISPNSKFIALGDYSGYIHILKPYFKKPQIMISHGSQISSGDQISIRTTEDEIDIQGFILSDLEIKNLKVDEKEITPSKTQIADIPTSAENIYQFSYKISTGKIESENRLAKIQISAQDLDDNSSQINILINKQLLPPEITFFTKPDFETSPDGSIQVKSPDKTLSIICYVFSDAPVAEVKIDETKITPQKINPDSILIPKPNRKYAYKFSKEINITSTKKDTIKTTILAKDIFNNLSSKMIKLVFNPVEIKTPPKIEISSVNVLIEETSEPSETNPYVEIDGFVTSNSPLSALLLYDSVEIPFYFHSTDGKTYKNRFNFTINLYETEQIANARYIKFTAIDQQNNSTTREILIPSEIGYLLSENFQKPNYPNVFALLIGVSKYELKALNHQPFATDPRSIANAIAKFTNIDKNNIYTLTDELASPQNIINYTNEILSKSKDNDFVFIFLSGYLIWVKSSQDVYYLTSKSSLTKLEENSLNMKNFLKLISSRPSNCKVMLVLDVNPATNPTEKFFGSPNAPISYKNSIKVLFEEARGILDLLIMSGTSENQKSIFGKNYANHGLFTYSLLNALTGEADDNADGIISLDEFITFTSLKVKELSNRKQNCYTYYNFDLKIPLFSMRKKSEETSFKFENAPPARKTELTPKDKQNPNDLNITTPPPPKKEIPKTENLDSIPFEEQYFAVVEDPPEIIGGLESIQRNVVYPEIAIRAGVEGTVYVMVFVDENGNVERAEVIKGIGSGCDEAAVSAIMQAKFIPGKQNGKPVKVRVMIPIRFKLKK
jgi:TonB family protein